MARPRIKPDYDKDVLQNSLMKDVSEAYINPPKGCADEQGHMQLKYLAEEFGMTPIKVRKILVTAGVYETEISLLVNSLYNEGKSVAEIQKITGLCKASVNGYLPYKKAVYKMEERTVLADRLVKYRKRKEAVEKLGSMDTVCEEEYKTQLWETLKVFEGYRFRDDNGVRFDYKIEEEQAVFSDGESYSKEILLEVLPARKCDSDERLEILRKRFDKTFIE